MGAPIITEPLLASAFAPFGDVIEAIGAPDRLINQGRCGRYHDRARLEFGAGRAGISLFRSAPVMLPYMLEMVERHPEGSQAFLPMDGHAFLITVCPDENGRPGTPRAFLSSSGQGINFHRGTWHGVLTPLQEPGLFAVVDRIGDGLNLEEHWFDVPYLIEETS